MGEAEEFMAMVESLKDELNKPPAPRPEPPRTELTSRQKRVVLEYILAGPGKGLFEDCEEFWLEVDNPEESYPSLSEAVDDYVLGLKQRLLAELDPSQE